MGAVLTKRAISRLYVILNTRKSNFAMCDYARACAHSTPLRSSDKIMCAQFLLLQHCEMYVNLPSYKIMEFLIASGLWVVLKEKSMEIIKKHRGYLASFS